MAGRAHHNPTGPRQRLDRSPRAWAPFPGANGGHT